jgi:hypothetical protein
VLTLLADANVEGHVARLGVLMQSSYWCEFWDHLDIRITLLSHAGLAADASDVVVWEYCQREHVYLLTNNRNDDGADSLEATIRGVASSASLPVFTFGDADRILWDSDYAERVVESLFDCLLRIDSLRGVGRMYLP